MLSVVVLQNVDDDPVRFEEGRFGDLQRARGLDSRASGRAKRRAYLAKLLQLDGVVDDALHLRVLRSVLLRDVLVHVRADQDEGQLGGADASAAGIAGEDLQPRLQILEDHRRLEELLHSQLDGGPLEDDEEDVQESERRRWGRLHLHAQFARDDRCHALQIARCTTTLQKEFTKIVSVYRQSQNKYFDRERTRYHRTAHIEAIARADESAKF